MDERICPMVPSPKVQPKIMKTKARFEHQVWEAGLPVAQRILDNPVTFDTADGVLDADTDARNQTIGDFVHVGQFASFGLLFGLEDRDALKAKALKAGILHQHAALGHPVARFIGEVVVMFAALNGLGDEADLQASL